MPADSPPERFPWWARALDVLAVAAVLVALTVFLTGGFREWLPFGRISVTSWTRPLLIAALALTVRHALRPRPILPAQLYASIRHWWRVSEAHAVWPIVVATRAGVLVVGFLAVVLIGYPPNAPPFDVYGDTLRDLPARWDTGWYLMVANDGYQWRAAQADRQQNIAFFPVYPMLMRYGSLFLGRETMWTGVLISWLAFFAALVYLYRFTRDRWDDERAGVAISLLACYPFAFFFSTAYTESLFLLTMIGACYHFERGELWKASFWGVIAGLTRPNGCLLSVVLGLMALRPLWPQGWRRWQPTFPPEGGWPKLADRLAAAAAPGIGMLIYSTYIFFLTGNPLQWAAQNAAWGRVYRGLGALVSQQSQRIGEHGLYTYAATRTLDAVQLIAVIFVLTTVWPIGRRIGLPYAAMILVNMVTPLLMGGLLSMGRVTSVLFPLFIWLGLAIPARQRTSWLAAFAMLQALLAGVFFTWRPLY